MIIYIRNTEEYLSFCFKNGISITDLMDLLKQMHSRNCEPALMDSLINTEYSELGDGYIHYSYKFVNSNGVVSIDEDDNEITLLEIFKAVR